MWFPGVEILVLDAEVHLLHAAPCTLHLRRSACRVERQWTRSLVEVVVFRDEVVVFRVEGVISRVDIIVLGPEVHLLHAAPCTLHLQVCVAMGEIVS